MKWLGGEESDNVEYSGGGRRLIGGGIGAGIIGLIIYLATGYTPQDINRIANQVAPTETTTHERTIPGSAANFASIVLRQTEVVWNSLFTARGLTYTAPKLNIFEDEVLSACGGATAAVGPFYCPGDNKIYLDLSFFNELKDRFGAPGDFANAYVIAHEVGHHIQYLLGTTQKMGRLRDDGGTGPNSISVRIELQADFYAGVWAHYAEKMNAPGNPVVIEPGDIEAALNAANAIGDDRLQQMSQGRVIPDAFTHGTSKQRMYWFKKGYETGDIDQGNIFDSQQ